jgi:hypothetical protein
LKAWLSPRFLATEIGKKPVFVKLSPTAGLNSGKDIDISPVGNYDLISFATLI